MSMRPQRQTTRAVSEAVRDQGSKEGPADGADAAPTTSNKRRRGSSGDGDDPEDFTRPLKEAFKACSKYCEAGWTPKYVSEHVPRAKLNTLQSHLKNAMKKLQEGIVISQKAEASRQTQLDGGVPSLTLEGGDLSAFDADVLMGILHQLDARDLLRLGATGRAWRDFLGIKSSRPEAFRKLEGARAKNMTEFISIISNPRYAMVRSLKIPIKCTMGPQSAAKILAQTPLVEELDLSAVKSLDADLIKSLSNFTALRVIKIGEPIYKTPSILFNSALKQVLIANPGIEELEYRGYFFPFIYDTTLRMIGEACPGLKVLKVHDGMYDRYSRQCDRHYGTSSITPTGFMSVVTNCPNLEVLEFRNTPLLGKDATATHDGLAAPLPEIATRVLPRCLVSLPESKKPRAPPGQGAGAAAFAATFAAMFGGGGGCTCGECGYDSDGYGSEYGYYDY